MIGVDDADTDADAAGGGGGCPDNPPDRHDGHDNEQGTEVVPADVLLRLRGVSHDPGQDSGEGRVDTRA